uniref:Adhesion G protein-coupled receptor F5 n=1 Tax=Sphenodon punctatus TaxID=8508 RepID=A0A8D0GQU7_SPHPU
MKGIVITNNSNASNFDEKFTFASSENLSGSVFINGTQFDRLKPNTIISVAYSTLRNILPQHNKTIINGLVITTTVSSNNSATDLQISLTFAKSNVSLKAPQCVFWNFDFPVNVGGWDAQGCSPKENGSNVICSCKHLTSFSILMSPNSTPLDIQEPLNYITYVGLSVSILSLVACILIEVIVWKSVTKHRVSYMRHICILNTAISLLIADVWFIVAAAMYADQKESVDVNACIAATFFIHLFYLCVFFWMFALGLMLFYRLVFILHDTSKTTQKAVAFCLGYGCPLVIAAITIGITQPQSKYRRDKFCWLNWKESKALLAFAIPALVIVVANSVIVVVVIVKILRPSIGDKPNKQERSSLLLISKGVGILTPLLGLTWGLGLAVVIKDTSMVFHVLFTLLNAFQGLFILVFGTLLDKKVQEVLLNKLSLSRWSSQQTKVNPLLLCSTLLVAFLFHCIPLRFCSHSHGVGGTHNFSSTDTSSSTQNISNAYSLLN